MIDRHANATPVLYRAFFAAPAIILVLLLMLVLVLVPGAERVSARPSEMTNTAFSHYELDVDFDPVARLLDGDLRVRWQNASGQPVDVVHFRLYPNASYYEEGDTVVSAAAVNGRVATTRLLDDPTVLAIDLGREVAPGQDVTIDLAFLTSVPTMSDGAFGILGGSVEAGWWLADWYPILAGWEAGQGPFIDPPTPLGDPTFAESATYHLTFTAPAGYRVLGSGVTRDYTVDGDTGQATTTIVSGLSRDLTLSLLANNSDPQDRPVTVSAAVGDTRVRVTLPQRLAVPGLGEEILDIAYDAFPVYEQWLGDYHEPELDIVPVPLAGTGGVSWHGIVWLDVDAIAGDGLVSASERELLRFVLTHELGHQWIAGIIGSNNNDHGYVSEGLTNSLTVLAIRETHGAPVAERYLRDWVASGYRSMVELSGDGVVDAPVRHSTDLVSRARLVYGKGALGFEAIRQEIGDAAFFAGLASYAREFRFGISTPEDVRRAFEVAGQTDLRPLWTFWFEEQATGLADIDGLLDGFAAD